MSGLAEAIRAAGHPVVSTDVTLRGLLASVAAHRPEVCLLDAGLVAAPAAVTARVSSASSGTRVVLLSGERTARLPAVPDGVSAVVSKHQSIADIVHALTAAGAPARPGRPGGRIPTQQAPDAVQGRRSTQPAGDSAAVHSHAGPGDPGWVLRFLTAQEWRVLTLLAAGEPTSRISAALGVRPVTARGYVQKLLEKLGVHSRLQATALLAAHRQGRRAASNPSAGR